jgi:hypothetical protein
MTLSQYIRARYNRLRYLLEAEGTVETLRRVLLGGLYRSIGSYIDYARYRHRYPVHLLFVAGFPKSGSSWFAQMLASLPGFREYAPVEWATQVQDEWSPVNPLYEGIFDEFRRRLAVVKGHTWGTDENVRRLREAGRPYFVTVRDPRDQMISAYWYIRRQPVHWDHEKATALSLREYITHKLESGEHEREELNWLRDWLRRKDDLAHLVRYEDLLDGPKAVMAEVFRHAGIDVAPDTVCRIVEAHRFENKTGRERGAEDTDSFARKGVSGEWRDVFTEEQRRLYVDLGEDVIDALGYPKTL